MNSQVEPFSLNEVLDAYLSASKTPNHEVLIEWIRRFPQFETELIDFTIAWNEIENLPSVQLTGLDADAFVAIGMKMAREAFEAKGNRHPETKLPIRSILDEGKRQGVSPDQLSDQLKLSITLVRKIDLRNILYSTIPLELIESLAQTIKRSAREVVRYLSLKPTVPITVRYKSSKAPKITDQKSFFDEVRRDQLLDEEKRNYWLSYEEKE